MVICGRLKRALVTPIQFERSLSADPDQLVQHFVSRGDDPGVGGIGALSHDHLRELVGNIDIGRLQRRG